jgi:hypothetical protein
MLRRTEDFSPCDAGRPFYSAVFLVASMDGLAAQLGKHETLGAAESSKLKAQKKIPIGNFKQRRMGRTLLEFGPLDFF